jgi:hypothetical protein
MRRHIAFLKTSFLYEFSKVTLYLANVLKATSSLLPFLLCSYSGMAIHPAHYCTVYTVHDHEVPKVGNLSPAMGRGIDPRN